MLVWQTVKGGGEVLHLVDGRATDAMCGGVVPDEVIQYPGGYQMCRQCKRAEVWVRRKDELAIRYRGRK